MATGFIDFSAETVGSPPAGWRSTPGRDDLTGNVVADSRLSGGRGMLLLGTVTGLEGGIGTVWGDVPAYETVEVFGRFLIRDSSLQGPKIGKPIESSTTSAFSTGGTNSSTETVLMLVRDTDTVAPVSVLHDAKYISGDFVNVLIIADAAASEFRIKVWNDQATQPTNWEIIRGNSITTVDVPGVFYSAIIGNIGTESNCTILDYFSYGSGLDSAPIPEPISSAPKNPSAINITSTSARLTWESGL